MIQGECAERVTDEEKHEILQSFRKPVIVQPTGASYHPQDHLIACTLLVPYHLSDSFLQISVVVDVFVHCTVSKWHDMPSFTFKESKDVKLYILAWYNSKEIGSNF